MVLTCHTESNIPIQYKLFKNGVLLTRQKQYAVKKVGREQAGMYSCQADNGLQQKQTAESKLTIMCRFNVYWISNIFPICKYR